MVETKSYQERLRLSRGIFVAASKFLVIFKSSRICSPKGVRVRTEISCEKLYLKANAR